MKLPADELVPGIELTVNPYVFEINSETTNQFIPEVNVFYPYNGKTLPFSHPVSLKNKFIFIDLVKPIIGNNEILLVKMTHDNNGLETNGRYYCFISYSNLIPVDKQIKTARSRFDLDD
jgi:carbonic anhydrase